MISIGRGSPVRLTIFSWHSTSVHIVDDAPPAATGDPKSRALEDDGGGSRGSERRRQMFGRVVGISTLGLVFLIAPNLASAGSVAGTNGQASSPAQQQGGGPGSSVTLSDWSQIRVKSGDTTCVAISIP